MNRRGQILWAVAIAGVVAWAVLEPGDKPGGAASRGACCPLLAGLDAKAVVAVTNRATTNASAQQVIAYYFHGTVRCETCLMIEQQAKATVEERFGEELAASRLVFVSVNYEQPENRHFMMDYKLPCPSLVLVRQKDGKEEKWKLLGETWQLVHESERLHRYVASEGRNYLSGQETSTNNVERPAAPGL